MNSFFLICCCLIIFAQCAHSIQDDFVNLTLKNSLKPNAHTKYNYTSTTKIPVYLKITEDIKSEKDIFEGQNVKFIVVDDVVYNGATILPKNTIIPAKVETIITSGMNGIPASIIFGSFKFYDKNKFDYTYEVFGQDRSLLVFPLKWALTPLPPTGSLTNLIMGGHAKLKTKKIITIYYHPEWI